MQQLRRASLTSMNPSFFSFHAQNMLLLFVFRCRCFGIYNFTVVNFQRPWQSATLAPRLNIFQTLYMAQVFCYIYKLAMRGKWKKYTYCGTGASDLCPLERARFRKTRRSYKINVFAPANESTQLFNMINKTENQRSVESRAYTCLWGASTVYVWFMSVLKIGSTTFVVATHICTHLYSYILWRITIEISATHMPSAIDETRWTFCFPKNKFKKL